ncbi:DeoR/GlpR family DNA-binding transcription regulator [Motilimonas cestriensis]|uniref:DeoR/GlpR family DNA-binding transcription regulator n=1 Tax=Motilimonas cestriensis TaxID=2742685 RepID=A0ABS8W7L1_9GAMM|nr:DeoR/GlpR family DNA-binding transcription regulator [Motilimonas cestriensis]
MLNQRQQDILQRLKRDGYISTESLADEYAVTTQTIRRTINDLCERGLARRQHGGVALLAANTNKAYAQRKVHNIDAKRAIARQVVNYLLPESTVFLGYGSTVAQVLEVLPKDIALTVITNNLHAVMKLTAFENIETWVAGGKLRTQDQDTSGFHTTQFIHQFRADIALCGVAAIDEQGALFEFQPEEAELTRALLANSQRKFLLADSTKYQRAANARVAHLSAIDDLFIEKNIPALQHLCQQHQVDIHLGDSINE